MAILVFASGSPLGYSVGDQGHEVVWFHHEDSLAVSWIYMDGEYSHIRVCNGGQDRLSVMGDVIVEGWTDPYFYLASHWAPVINQYTHGDDYKADFITRFDYDGDWVGNNNWDNLPNYDQIWAYAYYAVIETDTHFFIFYMFFHPRDWCREIWGVLDQHENDMEGVMLVVRKNGTKYGELQIMETRAHTDFYQYSNDPNVGANNDDVDGSIVVENGIPVVYVEAQGHGVYGDEGRVDNYYSYDGLVVYRYANNMSEYPTSNNDDNVSYGLISILRSLWPRRHDMGDGSTYDAPFIYQGARYNFTGEIPAAFDGDDYGEDKANPPWGMDDDDDGPVYQGDWFFDPAYTIAAHLSVPSPFSLNYTYNPYLIEDGPEFNPPTVDILSPRDGEYVMSSNVRVSWNVTDEFDLYNLSVFVDGEMVYSGKSRGYGEFIINLEDGIHELNVCAIDIWGNYRWVKRSFYVDTKAPRIMILEPSNNTYFNYTDVTISWEGTDENNISAYMIRVDGTLVATLDGGQNEYNYTFSEGKHNISVVAEDNSGRRNSSMVIITIDTTPPTISLLAPKNNSNMTYTSNVTVEWSGTDNINVEHYEVRVDGGDWENVGKNTSISLINLSLYWHTVEIKCVDLAGNIKKIVSRFYLNPSKPTLVSSNGDGDADIETSSAAYLSWVIEGDFDHFEIVIDGQDTINVGRKTHYLLKGLMEGVHNITIRVVYPAGDYVEKTYKVVVDKSPPTISTASSINAGEGGDTVSIGWNATDELTGVEHFELLVDGTWLYLGNTTSYDLNISTWPDGEYMVILRAFDRAGNYVQKPIIIVVDRAAPVITVLTPQNNSVVPTRDVVVSFNIDDNTSIRRVEIYLNGSRVCVLRSAYSYTLEGLKDGSYIMSILAWDMANNSAAIKVTFTVDTEAPFVVVIEPSDLDRVNTSTFTVSWNGSSDVMYYMIRLDCGAWINVGLAQNYTLSGVEDGIHVVYVMAVDAAYNRNITSIILIVEANDMTKNGWSESIGVWTSPSVVIIGESKATKDIVTLQDNRAGISTNVETEQNDSNMRSRRGEAIHHLGEILPRSVYSISLTPHNTSYMQHLIRNTFVCLIHVVSHRFVAFTKHSTSMCLLSSGQL